MSSPLLNLLDLPVKQLIWIAAVERDLPALAAQRPPDRRSLDEGMLAVAVSDDRMGLASTKHPGSTQVWLKVAWPHHDETNPMGRKTA
jgi:hypothetical protein